MARRSSPAVLLFAAVLVAGAAPAGAGELAVVTTRIIYPGELIGADVVEEVPLDRGNRQLGPIFQQAERLHGKVARRTILPGRLIPESAVREAYLVQQGAPVQVVYEDGGLVISITAVTLESGAAGDVVKLRNIESGVVFSGVVMADGSVKVGAS